MQYMPTPSSDGSTPPAYRQYQRPPMVALQAPSAGPNNGFAIAVLVISIVAIVVCILVVFLVKPCNSNRLDRVDVIVDAPRASASGGAAAGAGVMVPKDAADLEKMLQSGDAIVMFHATWCGHCKTTLPKFNAAAADMAKAGVKVIAADGDKVKEALKKYGIGHFPYIALYRNGKQKAVYEGDRSQQSLVDFVKKNK